MKAVTLLGSTGSIGTSALSVLAQHPDKYNVYALTANRSVDILFQQCQQFKPMLAVMLDENNAKELSLKVKAAGLSIQVLSGVQALEEVAQNEEVDYVVAAIVGAAGLLPILAAAKAGKRILLANKEALVMSGELLMREVEKHGATLLPVDSEHNAIWQCLPVGESQQYQFEDKGIRRIILTASGGPFRGLTTEQMLDVTVEQAVAHPNWSMGQKISVDSATLMNKGLELIEACWLFDASPDQIEVIVHPQSIVHSLVQYADGSVIAQLGNPDMRTPIAHALAWPERIDSGVAELDLFDIARLDFTRPDLDSFPCLTLASEAARTGKDAPAVLNASNEIAVQAFLDRRIGFTQIADVVKETLSGSIFNEPESLTAVQESDRRARSYATSYILEIER